PRSGRHPGLHGLPDTPRVLISRSLRGRTQAPPAATQNPGYRFLLLIPLANSESQSAASGLPMSLPFVEWVKFSPSTS
ncbi:hypothetical protein, partial [Pseudomonas sp. GM74]|uniref:hypothetical protein n=1 Tax=Pseudomonas sp. GM74 TaxID=1144336 RepID=UPI001EE6701F